MGIDVYLHWDGQTLEEYNQQITGWSVVHGHTGYLRESYNNGIFATKRLILEDWSKQPFNESAKKPNYPGCGFVIPNAELVKRLPATLELVRLRQKAYGEGPRHMMTRKIEKSFRDFVALHGKLERAGKNPRIYISY